MPFEKKPNTEYRKAIQPPTIAPTPYIQWVQKTSSKQIQRKINGAF